MQFFTPKPGEASAATPAPDPQSEIKNQKSKMVQARRQEFVSRVNLAMRMIDHLAPRSLCACGGKALSAQELAVYNAALELAHEYMTQPPPDEELIQ